MSILNVVQPDEFDPSDFSLIDGKLKVAISSLENNILQYKSDGLYASAGGDSGVFERYVYTTNVDGNVQHKGINFNIRLQDGALSGQIYGVDSANGLSPNDMIFYKGTTKNAMSDDSKYLLQMPWALEDLQRFILKMTRNNETVFWVVRVIRQPDHSLDQDMSATVIIDEMINIDDTATDNGVPESPELNDTYSLTHVGVIPITTKPYALAVTFYDENKFALIEIGEQKQLLLDSPNNITGQLTAKINDVDIRTILSYCPISGAVIYYGGNNYQIIANQKKAVLDLPVVTDGIIGINYGTDADDEDSIFCYTIDASSVSFQILTNTVNMTLTERQSHEAPGGDIVDWTVSGGFAHYLHVINDNYHLTAINLITGENTEHTLVNRNVNDSATLIPVGAGGVIVYIDTGTTRIVIPNLASLNLETSELELKLGDPETIQGRLLFADDLTNVGFSMNEGEFFKFFIDPQSMSVVRLSTSIMDGNLAISSAPIPQSFLDVLMTGNVAIPLSYSMTTMAFDISENGHSLTYETLELGTESVMYQSDALLKFDNGLAILAISPSGDLSIIKVNEDNTTDTTAYQLATEYGNTVNGFMEVSPALGVAVWKTRADKIVFTRFSETSNDIHTTVLGDSIYPTSWIMIDKDSAGNHFVKEKQSNDGLELRVWCIAPDNTVTVYSHPNINIEGSNLVGSDILGDKLLVFGNADNNPHIRVLDARTGTTLTQGNVAFHGNFNNLKLQRIDPETLLVVENIFATDDMPASIRVTLLKITATEVTVIKKSILALGTWGSINGSGLTNNTYTEDGASISYQSAIRDNKRYYVKIVASQTDFTVYEQEITQEILDKAGILVINGTYPMPIVTMINGNTGYIQHDLKLSSLNTFPLDMVEHDNSPKATALTAVWKPDSGLISITGMVSNPNPTGWTYARLSVETPSGQTYETKYRIGSNQNGAVARNLWVIPEPGDYIFKLSNWDGGQVMEARATVPNDGRDFTPPIVTADGDGEWLFSTTNVDSASRGVYNVYRSRTPVSIIDDLDGGAYVYNNIHEGSKRYTIPAEERNGVWYIMVGHVGSTRTSSWIPSFFTYGG